MITICAWCSDVHERTAHAIAQGHDITHGMCDACRAAWTSEIRDASGRFVAPAQPATAPRPSGPWDRNGVQP